VPRGIFAFAINIAETLVCRAKLRYLFVLIYRCYVYAAGTPRVTTLPKHRIIQLARYPEHLEQMPFLSTRGVQPNFVHPTQLAVEPRRRFHL
jgi:hypothetical protein